MATIGLVLSVFGAGSYINDLSFGEPGWLGWWTVFFWGWFMGYGPLMAMFIARVSKGRTVREFIIAVLLVPTLVTIVWMTAFGGSGLQQIQADVGQLANGITDVSLALFQMLENLPYTAITSFLSIILVLVFFITSSDSGSLVVDMLTSGGHPNPPIWQRVFWATAEGACAAYYAFRRDLAGSAG